LTCEGDRLVIRLPEQGLVTLPAVVVVQLSKIKDGSP
jgi:hypothetical protein